MAILHLIFVCISTPYLALGETYRSFYQGYTGIQTDIPLTVTEIYIVGTMIESIPDNAFSRYAQLEKLHLHSNKIASVSSTAFEGTPITVLQLNDNNLTSVPNLDFIGRTLTDLLLDNNYIKSFHESTFKQVTNLRHLGLGGNGISSLEPRLLQNTASSIQYISLRNNLLKTIPPEFFENMGSLATLSLYGNKLHNFPDFNILPTHNNLTSLQLGHNSFVTLPDNALLQLKNLEYLSMFHNQLIHFPNIENQKHLKSLDMRHNNLTNIPERAFIGLQLERLDLSDNNLQALPNVLPMNLTLERLYLSRNNIGPVPCPVLRQFQEDMTHLRRIYMEDNGLESFPDPRLVTHNRPFFYFFRLQNADTMVCDCRVSWMVDPSVRKDLAQFDVHYDGKFCASPPSLRDRTWSSLTPGDFCPNYTRSPVPCFDTWSTSRPSTTEPKLSTHHSSEPDSDKAQTTSHSTSDSTFDFSPEFTPTAIPSGARIALESSGDSNVLLLSIIFFREVISIIKTC